MLAVDLGCGSGQSSQVLGAQLPPGSTLLGYDICDRLLAPAAHRSYRDILGATLKASFVNQSIAQARNDTLGRRLDAGSVGLVHAAGIVGHHRPKPTSVRWRPKSRAEQVAAAIDAALGYPSYVEHPEERV